ncbi:hypothetical protein ACGFYV_00920 [Streptomyces sp. NPDC048297]|uniref:hypothetical protein n=1 Tax=Streptomyces sp. NPDC048297 TaxID=3365531 RepID=UPI003710DC4C
MTCEKLREAGAELALGVLSGRERAEAVAHLDHCAECREYVEQLTLVGDRLVGLLPDAQPPNGFETRVARRLAQQAPEPEDTHTRASGPALQDLRGRVHRARLRLASGVAAFAVVCGLAGWGISNAVEAVTASPAPAIATEPVLVGDFTSVTDGGKPVGEIYAHPGAPGWMFVTLALTGPRASYTGKVGCLLEHKDGTTVQVGHFSLRDGHGSWGVTAKVDPGKVTGVRLTSSDDTVLARAQLEVGQVQAPET